MIMRGNGCLHNNQCWRHANFVWIRELNLISWVSNFAGILIRAQVLLVYWYGPPGFESSPSLYYHYYYVSPTQPGLTRANHRFVQSLWHWGASAGLPANRAFM